MNVVFRVDAALHIGSGHVMRCLTLADELAHQGVNCIFICREFEGNLLALIKEKGYRLFSLCAIKTILSPKDNQIVPHEHWLGTNYESDAKQTIDIIKYLPIKIDWLIVDHYAIDIRWEQILRPYVNKIMLIDDLADRYHDCDVLLDQNYFYNFLNRYDKFVLPTTKMFLGPEYVLLKPEFSELRLTRSQSNLNTHKKNILVFFGGVDSTSETAKFLNACEFSLCEDIHLHVVIGQSNKDKDKLIKKYNRLTNITLYHFVHNMAQLMARMDYSFGACGSTNWERMCIGLNSSIVAVAQNQIELSNFLYQQSLVEYIGYCDEVTIEDYRNLIVSTDFNSNTMQKRREKIMSIVDGMGLYRICQFLVGN